VPPVCLLAGEFARISLIGLPAFYFGSLSLISDFKFLFYLILTENYIVLSHIVLIIRYLSNLYVRTHVCTQVFMHVYMNICMFIRTHQIYLRGERLVIIVVR
jgi:hypothetical protein